MAELSSSNSTPKYKQYNPFQDIDPNSPHLKLYNLPTSPELLFDEQAFKTRRNFSENVTFYTGTSYLAGSILGGLKGTIHGISAAQHGESLKIRTNRVLNTGGSMGRRFGNNAGLLGLIYSGMFSGIAYGRDDDGVVTCGLAGMATGAFFRIPGGFRSMVVAGVLGGIGVSAAVSGKELLKKYVNLPI